MKYKDVNLNEAKYRSDGSGQSLQELAKAMEDEFGVNLSKNAKKAVLLEEMMGVLKNNAPKAVPAVSAPAPAPAPVKKSNANAIEAIKRELLRVRSQERPSLLRKLLTEHGIAWDEWQKSLRA